MIGAPVVWDEGCTRSVRSRHLIAQCAGREKRDIGLTAR